MVSNKEILKELNFENIEEENQYFTDILLNNNNQKVFEDVKLEDGSMAALLSNDSRIAPQDKEILPQYMYIALSRHGITLINCSPKVLPGYEIMKKAISGLIEISDGEQIDELLVSEWKQFHRIRKTKGLHKLKAIIRTVSVCGINFKESVKDFYENILSHTSLF